MNDQVNDDNYIPPVIPLLQNEISEDGSLISKRVKPLTYSLMSWVKNTLELPDTIDISDDENHGQWTCDVPSLDESFQFKCYFETDEENSTITFYIYYFDRTIDEEKIDSCRDFINEKNLYLSKGHFQIIETDESAFLRYIAGISLKGIASDDPEYTGDFQISPKIYDNIFRDGFTAFNSYIDEFIDLLED